MRDIKTVVWRTINKFFVALKWNDDSKIFRLGKDLLSALKIELLQGESPLPAVTWHLITASAVRTFDHPSTTHRPWAYRFTDTGTGTGAGAAAGGGGRGARGIGGRVEPEGGRGGGRGAVECVGEAASRSVKHDTVWKINKFKVARM